MQIDVLIAPLFQTATPTTPPVSARPKRRQTAPTPIRNTGTGIEMFNEDYDILSLDDLLHLS